MSDIDWTRIVLNIRREGLSYRAQERKVGMNKDTLGKIARGEVNEPRYSTGKRLVDLHEKMCPDRHKEMGL